MQQDRIMTQREVHEPQKDDTEKVLEMTGRGQKGGGGNTVHKGSKQHEKSWSDDETAVAPDLSSLKRTKKLCTDRDKYVPIEQMRSKT
jgi:hypothetical protein